MLVSHFGINLLHKKCVPIVLSFGTVGVVRALSWFGFPSPFFTEVILFFFIVEGGQISPWSFLLCGVLLCMIISHFIHCEGLEAGEDLFQRT